MGGGNRHLEAAFLFPPSLLFRFTLRSRSPFPIQLGQQLLLVIIDDRVQLALTSQWVGLPSRRISMARSKAASFPCRISVYFSCTKLFLFLPRTISS